MNKPQCFSATSARQPQHPAIGVTRHLYEDEEEEKELQKMGVWSRFSRDVSWYKSSEFVTQAIGALLRHFKDFRKKQQVGSVQKTCSLPGTPLPNHLWGIFISVWEKNNTSLPRLLPSIRIRDGPKAENPMLPMGKAGLGGGGGCNHTGHQGEGGCHFVQHSNPLVPSALLPSSPSHPTHRDAVWAPPGRWRTCSMCRLHPP